VTKKRKQRKKQEAGSKGQEAGSKKSVSVTIQAPPMMAAAK